MGKFPVVASYSVVTDFHRHMTSKETKNVHTRKKNETLTWKEYHHLYYVKVRSHTLLPNVIITLIFEYQSLLSIIETQNLLVSTAEKKLQLWIDILLVDVAIGYSDLAAEWDEKFYGALNEKTKVKRWRERIREAIQESFLNYDHLGPLEKLRPIRTLGKVIRDLNKLLSGSQLFSFYNTRFFYPLATGTPMAICTQKFLSYILFYFHPVQWCARIEIESEKIKAIALLFALLEGEFSSTLITSYYFGAKEKSYLRIQYALGDALQKPIFQKKKELLYEAYKRQVDYDSGIMSATCRCYISWQEFLIQFDTIGKAFLCIK